MSRVAIVAISLLTCTASAQTLDQVSPYVNASFNMFTPSLNWQQEVVVGLAGPLVQVDLYVIAGGSCTFYINDGAPWQTDPPNWSTTFTSATTGWVSVDTSAAGVFFNPGDRFVLGFIGGGNTLNLGGSYLPPGGGYPAGELWLNNAIHGGGGWDVAFRTYVPEPCGPALWAAALLLFRRR